MAHAVVKHTLRCCEWAVVGTSALMIMVTLAQVVFRYVFAAPITWSEELARYCFVWIVYLGAPIALHRGLHIGVDNLTSYFSKKVQRVMEAINDAIALALVLLIGFASIEVLSANRLQFSPALGIQMAIVYLAIPVCMGVMALVLVAKFLRLAGLARPDQRP